MASNDKRSVGGHRYPVARLEFAQQTFPMTGTGAQTDTIANVSGTIVAMDVITTDTQDGITYQVAITNGNAATLIDLSTLADNSILRKVSRSNKGTQDADFNEQPVADETLTVTITPSAAPDNGEVGSKTATVDVHIYLV